MLRKLIVSLRRKPPHVRSAVALWTAIVFTGVTALVWALHAPEKIAARQENFTAETDTPGFSDFISDIGEQAAAAKAGVEAALDESETESLESENPMQDMVDQIQRPAGTGATGASSTTPTDQTNTIASSSVSTTATASSSSEPTPRPVRIINRASTSASSTIR